MEVEEPETSEDPTQSFEIHNIIRRRTQLLAAIIYIILNTLYIIYYLDIVLQDSHQSTGSVQCSTVNTSAWYRGRKLLGATPLWR